MDEPPFSLAFVMVKESFVVPARLFYLASDANKNKRPDHLETERHHHNGSADAAFNACIGHDHGLSYRRS